MLSNHQGESVLDRATVESDASEEHNEDRILHTSDALGNSTIDADKHLSKRKRLSGKVKSLLHVHNDQLNIVDNADLVTLAASPDVTSGDSRLDEKASPEPASQGFKSLAHHPIDTIRAKTERKTNKEVAAKFVSPEVTHTQDVELVRAQNTLNMAQTEEEKEQAWGDMEKLKKSRQDLFVRWTMDRHVLKLRQLDGNDSRERSRGKPDSEADSNAGWIEYCQQIALEQVEKYGGQYIGSFAEPPPASQETISAHIERLLVASSPWQELMMHVRRIYRWENQKETSMYLAGFLILWMNGALCAAGCLALIGQVLRRRFESPSVDKLRQEIKRTEDSMSTAHTLTEQIEKKGAQSWIDPLIEEMGEWLLLQLGDMANLLEVLLNFYEWRQPNRTAWTLAWFGVGSVAFYMTPVWLLVKCLSLFSGLMFFGLFPIASRYPRYRLLASPAKWLFWNIPTHAEWAVARLQVEGRRQADRETVHEDGPWDMSISATDAEGKVQSKASTPSSTAKTAIYGSYTCSSAKHDGRLVVTAKGVRFESFLASRHHWEVAYDRMHRVEKVNTIVQIGSGQDLLFLDTDGVSYSASNVASRDVVFTQIIGYSSVKWQVVG